MTNNKLRFLIFISIATLWACNPTKRLADDEYLLTKYKVKVIEPEKSKKAKIKLGLEKEELKSYIKQKPNRKILGIFRFHLGVYNFASRKRHKADSLKRSSREGKIEDKLKKIVGEPPVILDVVLTQKSTKQIKLYLNSKGYFNSSVNDTIILKKKKAKVKYLINPGKR